MLSRSMPFNEAAPLWLEDHASYIRPGTLRVYRQYVKSLSEFFQAIPLEKLQISNVRAYQRWRSEHACPTRVNAEIQSALKPILKEVQLWRNIFEVYKPLPVHHKRVRQNMSEEEERRLLTVALDAGHPRRMVAGHCMVTMMNTGMGFGELRHLRREDVVLNEDKPFVTVNPEAAKNEFRIRTIPLNWLALRSMRWIVRRWEDLGGTEPTEFILPHHATRTAAEKAGKGHKRTSPPDFTKPMGHIYKAARGILAEAGLDHLDPYDLRSHFGTKLLSDPNVSDQLFQELFGHSNTRTRDRYSKQRMEKKSVAVEKLALDPAPAVKLIAFPGGRKY